MRATRSGPGGTLVATHVLCPTRHRTRFVGAPNSGSTHTNDSGAPSEDLGVCSRCRGAGAYTQPRSCTLRTPSVLFVMVSMPRGCDLFASLLPWRDGCTRSSLTESSPRQRHKMVLVKAMRVRVGVQVTTTARWQTRPPLRKIDRAARVPPAHK